jgi:hypothetical protein
MCGILLDTKTTEEDIRMEKDMIRETILEAMTESLDAQLRAVRRLRGKGGKDGTEVSPKRGMSQTEMAYDILVRARKPLHVTEIIDRVEKGHGVRLDRESLVSALAKRVAREDRFVRTDKNTFAVRGEDR